MMKNHEIALDSVKQGLGLGMVTAFLVGLSVIGGALVFGRAISEITEAAMEAAIFSGTMVFLGAAFHRAKFLVEDRQYGCC